MTGFPGSCQDRRVGHPVCRTAVTPHSPWTQACCLPRPPSYHTTHRLLSGALRRTASCSQSPGHTPPCHRSWCWCRHTQLQSAAMPAQRASCCWGAPRGCGYTSRGWQQGLAPCSTCALLASPHACVLHRSTPVLSPGSGSGSGSGCLPQGPSAGPVRDSGTGGEIEGQAPGQPSIAACTASNTQTAAQCWQAAPSGRALCQQQRGQPPPHSRQQQTAPRGRKA